MYHSLRTKFLNIVCERSMISSNKLHSADRSTSIIRRTIASKTEITGRETLIKSREGIIVSSSSNQCKTTTEKAFMVPCYESMIRKCYSPASKLPVHYRSGSRCDCDCKIKCIRPHGRLLMCCVDHGAYGITSCKLRNILNSGTQVSILITGNQTMFNSYHYENALYVCEYVSRQYSKLANKLIARGMDATKLTKKEIIAVLAVYYGKQETYKKNKPILVELLKAEIELNEHLLHAI
jgi:hypothetical protein